MANGAKKYTPGGTSVRETCAHCGSPLKRKRYTEKLICCSMKCADNLSIEIRYEEAKKKNTFVGVTTKPGTVRRILLYKYGNICSICRISKWGKNPVPVVMDHIDGDSDNWDFDNLRLICRNCDGQLLTFAGRNVGKFGKMSKRMTEQNERIKSGKQKYRKI